MSPRPIVFVVANRRKAGWRADHPALVKQGQPAGRLQHPLDDEHHVGPPGVVLVEAERNVVLQRPRQDAVPELGDLLTLLQHDRILADEVDTRDVAVEVDADARPVEPSRDLLDMRRLAGAVVAGHHDAAIARETGEDRESRVLVEQVVGIEVRHVRLGLGVGRRLHVAVDAEHLADRDLHVRHAAGPGLVDRHALHEPSFFLSSAPGAGRLAPQASLTDFR